MWLLILFLLIASTHSFKFLKPISNSASLTFKKLLSDVISELYLRENISFDIVTLGNIEQLLFSNIMNAVQEMPVTVKRFENLTAFDSVVKNKKLIFNQSAIFLGFDNEIKKLNFKAKLLNEFPKELKFLILTKIVPSKNFTNQPTNIKAFEYFLYFNKTKVDFLTFEWFTADECSKEKLHVINTFDLKSQKWKKPFGRVEKKFRNFHGCTIVARQTLYSYKDKFGYVRGQFFDVLDVVGSKANFTVYRQLLKNNFNVINNNTMGAHIISSISFFHDNFLHLTTSFENERFTMMITKGEKYVSYEKLFLPFDITTWCLLLITFTSSFFTIFIINHMSKQIKNLIFEGTHFPAFNVLGTFFGISQTHLPETNIPRIILMHFILFCLVIRTAYQGVFFEMMATDMRKHVPTSIDGLLEENYTIYTFTDHTRFEIFNQTIARGQKVNYKFVNKSQDMCTAVEEALKDKAAYIAAEIEVKFLTFRCIKNYLMLDSAFMSYPIATATERNHFMFHVINEVVEQTIPAGIPQYFYKIFYDTWFKKSLERNEELESLKLEDWRFGFELWLACLAFSTIVFIIEILQWPNVKEKCLKEWKIIKQRRKNIKIEIVQVKPVIGSKNV